MSNQKHHGGQAAESLELQQQGLAMNESRLQAIIDDLDAATHYFAGAAGDEVKSIHASLKAASNILVNLPSPIATPRSVEYLVLSIAANQFTVPLPTGKEIVRAVNNHEALVDALNAMLTAERCPNCPDQGWYADGPTDDPEQVQCEWCECFPTSLFKAKQQARAALVLANPITQAEATSEASAPTLPD